MTDRQWEDIKDLLPAAKPSGRPRSLQLREIVNAIYYLLVSGCQWRMLPERYPPWQSVYRYFRQWSRDGTWQRVHDRLRARLRPLLKHPKEPSRSDPRHKHPTAAILDSQSAKTASRRGIRGYDAGKRVTGRKRHLLVDVFGMLLGVIVTAASDSDTVGAIALFERLRRLGGHCKKLRLIWADQSYKLLVEQWLLLHTHAVLKVVKRLPGQKGFVVLPRRWVVERTFAWLTQCRRLKCDYEVLTEHSETMIYLAMIRLMGRRLEALEDRNAR
jgi:putative transposase